MDPGVGGSTGYGADFDKAVAFHVFSVATECYVYLGVGGVAGFSLI